MSNARILEAGVVIATAGTAAPAIGAAAAVEGAALEGAAGEGTAVAVEGSTTGSVGALTRLAVRAQLAMANNPAKSFAAGFAMGYGKTLLSGTSGLPQPVLPTAAMQMGYRYGENFGRIMKLVNAIHGIH